MADVLSLPERRRAEREASEWIARLHSDDASRADRLAFESWCDASTLNRRAYEDLLATWRRFTDAGRIVRAVSVGQSLGEMADRRPAFSRRMLAAAAGLVLLAGLAGLWMTLRETGTLFQTAIGEHASVRLPDGSLLELNSNSRARIEYDRSARVVVLDRGEAYFKVAHEAARPFWVVASNSWVRAVGTEFNVDLRPGAVRVTVREGTIKVAAAPGREPPSDARLAKATAAFVHAGQQAEMQGAATQIRTLAAAGVARSTSWRLGVLTFANEPLSRVVEELSRYTTLDIEIGDEALRALPVGGAFEAGPAGAEALLTMLADGFGLSVQRQGHDRVLVDVAERVRIDR